MATVSVIMSVYNTARYLRESVQSVMRQTYTDWELWLIDDGSTDESAALCDELGAQDPRIQVVHKENSGQADSRNTAIDKAHGEYICFIDSDDWIEVTMLERLKTLLDDTQADAAVCSYYEEYTDGQRHIHNEHTGTFSRKELLPIYYMHQNMTTFVIWGMLIKKSLLTPKIPLLRYCEDTAIIIQWISQARCITVCDEPLYHYRMRSGSVMHIRKQAERATVNLEVIAIRNEYARKHQLLADDDINRHDALAILHTTLQFVRRCPSATEREQVALYASHLLDQLRNTDYGILKKRPRQRLLLLYRHPQRFAWQQYLSGLFSFHEHRRSRATGGLYE